MPDTSARLAALADREDIRNCIAALARGEDRRDGAVISRCFWGDATVDFGIFAGSFQEYLAWVVPGAPSIANTLHTLGQSVIDLRGACAVAETHVTAYHRIDFGAAEHDVVLGARYLDELALREGEWRIARRSMLYDWYRDFGVSVDWSQGLMGMPFLRGMPVGRAAGDRSEIFFG